jgi:hypothetical protein
MMRFGLSRGQKPRRDDDLPIGNYAEALAVWQIQNGLNSLSLTIAQTERLRAVEKARGDVGMAKHLIYQRRRYRSQELNDAKR